MLNRILKMPAALSVMLVWIVIWILVVSTERVFPALCGKGISVIDGQYYRFFTAGLTHKHAVHMLANVCGMFWLGVLYENHVGSLRFLLVGLVCAVLCAILYLTVYKTTTGSYGGSSYTFALLGFGLTMQLLVPGFPKLKPGTWSGNWLIIYMIAGNIPHLPIMDRLTFLPFVDLATIVFHAVAFALGTLAALALWLLGMR